MAVNLTIVTGEVGHSLMAAKKFSYALQQPMNIRPLQARAYGGGVSGVSGNPL